MELEGIPQIMSVSLVTPATRKLTSFRGNTDGATISFFRLIVIEQFIIELVILTSIISFLEKR
jgi:hypothetical protein